MIESNLFRILVYLSDNYYQCIGKMSSDLFAERVFQFGKPPQILLYSQWKII